MSQKSFRRKSFLIFSIILLLHTLSCKKIDNFLDAKNNINDVRPTTLKDMQAILNDDSYMNDLFPPIGVLGTDNYYLTDENYDEVERNAYIWAKDVYGSEASGRGHWSYAYQVVEYANIVLDGLKNIQKNSTNLAEYNNIKGEAEFFRSYAYYMLSQVFCKPYMATSAKTDLGLVLRQNSDINEKSTRSSVEATYQQMLSDFSDAANLLPTTPAYQTQPCRAAANAALAKVYLSMGDYKKALKYASMVLEDYNVLLDYDNTNDVDLTSTYHFPAYPHNKEIIWYAQMEELGNIYNDPSEPGVIDSVLYGMYDDNDLRKSLYFMRDGSGNVHNAGSYTASMFDLFCGIAVNEIYLIKAECEARQNDISGALNDLNTLLKSRYKAGTFTDIMVTTSDDALKIVLKERRKELPFTGQLRWEDLRRLNQDSRFAVTLTRTLGGQIYTLQPNDPKYVLPIPEDEIQLSGIQQNDR